MLANENGYFLLERKVKDDKVIGNGKMLVYMNKADILSFHGGGYTTPSFIELMCSFDGEEFECRSARNAYTSTYVHRLYECGGFKTVRKLNKIIEDARIVDVMHPSSQIFVRYCENILPFRFDMKIPPYVRKVLNQRYKIGRKYYQVLSLVMPAGVSFYKNEVTFSETRMLIVAQGDARFTADGNTIEILPGVSRVIFVSGDGRSCIENAKLALEDPSYFEGRSQIVYDSEEFWKNEIARSDISDEHKDREMLEDALLALVSHQSAEGGVIAGPKEPIIRSDSIDDIVSAFLSLGFPDRAKRVLDFFCKRFELYGCFYQIYGTESAVQYERYFSDTALGAAKLITAFINYSDKTGDVGYIKENFSMLKKAMYAQIKELSLGMMPFSGCEIEISDEILGMGVQCHGSLESTVAAYSSVLRFVEFCDKHSLKLQNDNGSSARRADEIISSIKRYFIMGDKVTMNVPVREKNIKKRRFLYGDCDMCRYSLSHVYYGELELGSNGVYMCPKCHNDNFGSAPFEISTSFTPQASAVLFSEPKMYDALGRKKMLKLLDSAVKERQNDMLVRTVRSDTYFLEAANYFDIDDYRKMFREFIKNDLENSVYPRTVCYDRTKGKFDTRTIARVIYTFI